MLSKICKASCSTLCVYLYAQLKQACTDVFRHCSEWTFANVLLKYLFCDFPEVISLCVDDSPFPRSAFKPLCNCRVSPPYVQYSCWRLTAYILPVFNLMFKCHRFFLFVFRLFLLIYLFGSLLSACPLLQVPCIRFSSQNLAFHLKNTQCWTTHSVSHLVFISTPGTPF